VYMYMYRYRYMHAYGTMRSYGLAAHMQATDEPQRVLKLAAIQR